MGHKCYISFKTEDKAYKKHIQEKLSIDMIDKSLDEAIDSHDEDYVMQKIRNDYLSDSTVTIHLIGSYGAENRGYWEQRYIKRELQASLYDGTNNSRSGILGVVLPLMYDNVYRGSYDCSACNPTHNISYVNINDSTTIKEFSYNYYIPNNKCCHFEEDRYCVLVKWEDFCKSPETYIDIAFNKRADPISKKVKVRPEL